MSYEHDECIGVVVCICNMWKTNSPVKHFTFWLVHPYPCIHDTWLTSVFLNRQRHDMTPEVIIGMGVYPQCVMPPASYGFH